MLISDNYLMRMQVFEALMVGIDPEIDDNQNNYQRLFIGCGGTIEPSRHKI